MNEFDSSYESTGRVDHTVGNHAIQSVARGAIDVAANEPEKRINKK